MATLRLSSPANSVKPSAVNGAPMMIDSPSPKSGCPRKQERSGPPGLAATSPRKVSGRATKGAASNEGVAQVSRAPESPSRGCKTPASKIRLRNESFPDADGKPWDKPNPFFEKLLVEEVWHRRMPSAFPFGETPYIERMISRQITEDLASDNGSEEPKKSPHPRKCGEAALAKGVTDAISSVYSRLHGTRTWQFEAIQDPELELVSEETHYSPWTLPPVSEARTEAAVVDLRHILLSSSFSKAARDEF